jgi:hypothetical protein
LNRAGLFLVMLGLLQMAADVFHLATLKAIAAADGASPAPKVFSTVQGLETFSSQFYVEWEGRDGEMHTVNLTPELYSRILGPYNRRNVFGAVLAYAPILSADQRTKPMYDSVVRYALCGSAPLLHELRIDTDSLRSPARVRLIPRVGSRLRGSVFLIDPGCT